MILYSTYYIVTLHCLVCPEDATKVLEVKTEFVGYDDSELTIKTIINK